MIQTLTQFTVCQWALPTAGSKYIEKYLLYKSW